MTTTLDRHIAAVAQWLEDNPADADGNPALATAYARIQPAEATPDGVAWDVQRTDAGVTFTEVRPTPAAAMARVAAAAGFGQRTQTMARIAADDADARWMAGRRKAARKAGYRGPLTRDELAAQAGR